MLNQSRRITLLVPVRNGEATLRRWLDRATAFADCVIALDDGSTDRTREILESHPLVDEVLSNPRRRGYLGWNDWENRQRLVDAATRRDQSWLMFLDSDESIDPEDADALRQLINIEALPGFAYGFEVFRLHSGGTEYDPRGLWVFRLFWSGEEDTDLPRQKLHFVPVPESIPRRKWLQTSIRIQHFGSETQEHREERYRKYAEVDPDDRFHQQYESLLSPPLSLRDWPKRRAETPLVLGTRGRYADLAREASDSAPAMTVVVIAQNDEDVILRSVEAIESQQVDVPIEVIVVGSGSDSTIALVESAFPHVRTAQLPMPVLPGVARNVGLWMANGPIITFPGSHVWLSPGSLQHRLDAHDAGWDMVTCAVENGNPTAAGWASYLLDHSGQLPTRPSGEFVGAPGHASYSTSDLRRLGGFPIDRRTGEDTVVNQALYASGKRTYFSAEAAFSHASPSRTVSHLVRHRFRRGQGLGRILRRGSPPPSVLTSIRTSVALANRRKAALASGMRFASPTEARAYDKVRWHVRVGLLASLAGTMFELIRPVATGQGTAPVPRHDRASGGRIVAIGGRPGPGSMGLLAPTQIDLALSTLEILHQFGETVESVTPAVALNVTSAALTAEGEGNFAISLSNDTVTEYLNACRGFGAMLLLHLQPGETALDELIARWRHVLEQRNVGLILDVRPSASFAQEYRQSPHALSQRVHKLLPQLEAGYVQLLSQDSDLPNSASDVALIDLTAPTGALPNEALTTHPKVQTILYI